MYLKLVHMLFGSHNTFMVFFSLFSNTDVKTIQRLHNFEFTICLLKKLYWDDIMN